MCVLSSTNCIILLGFLLILSFVYLRVVFTLKYTMESLYTVENKYRAALSYIFPWRSIVVLREDLKLQRAALTLAKQLGIDSDELVSLAKQSQEDYDQHDETIRTV